MEVLNDSVDPPIKVLSKITRSLNHWSSNKYVDPKDEVPYFEEDLTPTELGHSYYWKLTTDQWILVHMPYKVMDSDTGKLVKGLKTYKSCPPYVNGSLPERHLKNPKSCIKDFRLNKEDFKVFSRRVRLIEGVLTHDEVDVELLSEDIRVLENSIDSFNTELLDFRYEASLLSSGKYYESEEHLSEVLNIYREFRVRQSEINARSVKIVVEMDKLSKETSRETEKVRISEEFDHVQKKLNEFRSAPIQRYEREAIHKCRVEHGKDTNESVPTYIRDLAHELNELKTYYPCLSRLRVVSNDEVGIDLTGVDISLTKETVIVRGDPGALKAYVGDNSSAEVDVGGRRVRSIIGAGQNKK